MSREKYYTLDRENWADCTNEKQVIIEQAESNNCQFVFCGERVDIDFNAFLSTDSIIENMQDHALNDYGDLAENYLRGVNVEQEKDLESVICAWAEKHNLKPSFFDIENIQIIHIDDLKWKEGV